jgi:His-Xaa-Ser system radical SAM maturase HxsB
MASKSPLLRRRFVPCDAYQAKTTEGYSLLPLRFLPLDQERYVLTNFAGEHIVLSRGVFHEFVTKQLPMHSPYYNELKSRHCLIDGESHVALELLAAKYRTKQLILSEFTGLHIFVATLRCNNRCTYCQVSRQGPDKPGYDMTESVADKAVDFMFRSPSRALKVEFQGGEPLLHFGIVKYIVEKVEQRNKVEGRTIEFVICTNLSLISDEILEFCAQHDVYFSTSLDGPRPLHNANRPNTEFDSYERTVSGIRRVREALGPHKIAALLTTTSASLSQPVEIMDEYLRQGFNSVFLRMINPYGFAVCNAAAAGYHVDEWLVFYKQALDYVLELNYQGVPFREEYASLVLKKMLTPYGTGFVDLQSPAGIGISVVVFNYDGNVYASDEARMLAEMGDRRFCLGNLDADSYETMMLSDSLIGLLKETMAEGVPGCVDCALQPFCGSDPVRHYCTQGDPVGYKPTSDFCRKNMGIIKHLIGLLEDDVRAARVLTSWI